jgi:hypothetical protein
MISFAGKFVVKRAPATQIDDKIGDDSPSYSRDTDSLKAVKEKVTNR